MIYYAISLISLWTLSLANPNFFGSQTLTIMNEWMYVPSFYEENDELRLFRLVKNLIFVFVN